MSEITWIQSVEIPLHILEGINQIHLRLHEELIDNVRVENATRMFRILYDTYLVVHAHTKADKL